MILLKYRKNIGGGFIKNCEIGLQLYSVRENLVKDFDGTLKKVKEMGYDYVEFAGQILKVSGMLSRSGLLPQLPWNV